MKLTWPGEVRLLERKLVQTYSVFWVRRKAPNYKPVKPRGARVDLDGLLERIVWSETMAAHIPTAEQMYRYIRWCNSNVALPLCTPLQLSAVNRLTRVQHEYNPLYLHSICDHMIWINDADMMLSFKSHGGEEKKGRDGSKRRSLPKAVRNMVWNTYIGKEHGMGECHCCKGAVSQQEFECGHVLAASKGGSNEVGNLRVLCHACNSSMGNMHMDDFIEIYFPTNDN